MTGGLQDNGQSILRGRDKVMGSNFGGDLAVFYRPAGTDQWQVLGKGLPTTAVLRLSLGPDSLYAATHGRGIRSFDVRRFKGRTND
ncbi:MULTISPECIES: hypothetical protein [unclassified Streptomyces]|uniref:hypothetical protein n=1 Tax=unclassified Streptomyces TaxID=2593676 RepID=UPI0037FC416D